MFVVLCLCCVVLCVLCCVVSVCCVVCMLCCAVVCCVVLYCVVLPTVQRATKLDFHINEGNIMTRGISCILVSCLRKHIAGRSAKAEGPHFPYFCFKAQWLLYVPPSITLKTTRSAHTVHL